MHSDPFAPATEADSLMLAPEDPRRPAVKVANPLSEDQPQLRTTLLPGLFRTLVRNIGRGFPDTDLFEAGQVFLPRPGSPDVAPILAIDRGPTEAELAALAAALPDQPLRVAGVLDGQPRAARLVGTWAGRDLVRRDRGGALRRRGVPPVPRRAGGGRGALAPRPVRRPVRAGFRGMAARNGSGWPGTRANCTRA